jgi:hypothetical protein
LRAIGTFTTILSVKIYRLALEPSPASPVLPCLDHEAMLHETVDPHAAVYVQDHGSDDLHELVLIPSRRLIVVDTASTLGEHSPEAEDRLRARLGREFPDYRLRIKRPSWWRGERRVAAACRAQVRLRDVLLGNDLEAIEKGIDRLQIIGMLMEKESRVASWGARTITGPLLAAAAFVTYVALGQVAPHYDEVRIAWLRYGLIGLLGGIFLYYGLKAVQLTGMSNRVWKRSAEYKLILSERRRLMAQSRSTP